MPTNEIMATIPEDFKPKLRQFATCTLYSDANKSDNMLINDQDKLKIQFISPWTVKGVRYFNICWSTV